MNNASSNIKSFISEWNSNASSAYEDGTLKATTEVYVTSWLYFVLTLLSAQCRLLSIIGTLPQLGLIKAKMFFYMSVVCLRNDVRFSAEGAR